MTLDISRIVSVVPLNLAQRIAIAVKNTAGTLVDVEAGTLSLQVVRLGGDLCEDTIFEETFDGTGRIIQQSTGRYYINWGDPTAPENTPSQTETNFVSTFQFTWSFIPDGEFETVIESRQVEIVSTIAMRAIGDLRSVIDKARAVVSDDPASSCNLGYTNGDLLRFLYMGLQEINNVPPGWPSWEWVDCFPVRNGGRILIDASLVAGINAQQLFATITDIEGYSDQGRSFVVQKQPKLAAFQAQLLNGLRDRISQFKTNQWRHAGSVHIRNPYGARYTIGFDRAGGAYTGGLISSGVSYGG